MHPPYLFKPLRLRRSMRSPKVAAANGRLKGIWHTYLS